MFLVIVNYYIGRGDGDVRNYYHCLVRQVAALSSATKGTGHQRIMCFQ